MQEFIAQENIKRFKQQLENCTDEQQRKTLTQLLAAEEAKLKELGELSVPSQQPSGLLRM